MKTRWVWSTGILAVALLAGCGSSSSHEGTWQAADPAEAYLELGADGTLSGTDGCNRLRGEWTESDGTLDFGPVASTMMACDGVDAWLSAAATATVSGTTMTVLDDAGTDIGTLTKKS